MTHTPAPLAMVQTTFSTSRNMEGRLVVRIDNVNYELGKRNTSEGLMLSHQLQRILAPAVSQMIPEDGKIGVDFRPDIQTSILAFSIGLNEMPTTEFPAFAKFMLSGVSIVANNGTKHLVNGVFDDHFADKLDHVSLLMAHVALEAGVIRFFAGLLAMMNSLSPAPKSASTSQTDSTGSSSTSLQTPA